MSSLVISGDTSGSVTLQAPAVAGSTILTLPATSGTVITSASGTAATATNLAGGSNGTIPYQSASGTTQMLAVGSAGQLLQTNGAGAPTWVTVSSGFSLISTQSGSGASAVTWSGLSGSTNYLVVLSGLADTTANRDTRIRVGTGGTIITSGYVYSGQIYGAGGPAAYGGTGAGLILSLDGAYLRYFYGFIYITQPPNYSAVNFNGATNDNTSASFGNTITGAVPTSAIISDIQVYSPNNFNFGSAALYKMAV